METAHPVVYIVEDDCSMRRALERLVQAAGFETQSFGSGGEFLASGHGSRPACVVLDLRLPDMHGLEVQRRLARTDPSLMVVVVTSYEDELTRREALGAGAISFLSKPFDDRILLEAIGRALGGSSEEGPP